MKCCRTSNVVLFVIALSLHSPLLRKSTLDIGGIYSLKWVKIIPGICDVWYQCTWFYFTKMILSWYTTDTKYVFLLTKQNGFYCFKPLCRVYTALSDWRNWYIFSVVCKIYPVHRSILYFAVIFFCLMYLL